MNKHNILICDDELSVRESLKAYLEDNYQIAFAKNSQEATNAVKSSDCSLVIMDIKLPGISGIDIIKQIKQIKPGQKIIVLTGYESISIAEEVSKLGVASYLVKPVGKDKLLKTVADAIG